MSTSQLIGPPPAVAAYPFRPGDDRGTVEDLFLYTDSTSRPLRPPITLISPAVVGGTPEFRFEDADGAEAFDTAAVGVTYAATVWGSGFTLHRWTLGYESLVVLARTADVPFAPPGGVLDERASDAALPSVRVLVVNGVEVTSGPVRFEAGYNCDVTADPTAGEVTFAAVPGGGEGVFADCTPAERVLRTVSRAGPSPVTGAMGMDAADCLAVTPSEFAVTLRADCRPCADCDDYVRLYKALKKLDDSGRALAERAADVRDRYRAAVERWNAEKACREAHPMRVSGTAYVSGGSNCAAVVVAVCNPNRHCLADLSVRLDWSTDDGTGQVVSNSTVLYTSGGSGRVYVMPGAWPTWYAAWGSVDPGRSVRLKFSICFPTAVAGQSATLTATASAAGLPDFASETLEISFT